jgi:hypothetical protein
MSIMYEVVTHKTYKVIQMIEADSQQEAEYIGTLMADYDLNYDGNELTVTTKSQAFPKEEEKVFVAQYCKPTSDIGDRCTPPHVSIYEVRADYVIPRGEDDVDQYTYYQLRYFERSKYSMHDGKLFYIEEFPNKDEAFVRQAAENWTAGIKNLDLDYALGEDGKTMINTNLGDGYGSYGRLK